MEKAMVPHCNTLAWKIPWAEEPDRLQSMGSLIVRHNWATSLSLFTFMHWRRKWQPTPAFLPGESQGRGNLVGCLLWGRTESDTTEVTSVRFSSVAQSCLTLCDPMNRSTLGLPVHHQLPELSYIYCHIFVKTTCILKDKSFYHFLFHIFSFFLCVCLTYALVFISFSIKVYHVCSWIFYTHCGIYALWMKCLVYFLTDFVYWSFIYHPCWNSLILYTVYRLFCVF